MTSKTLAQELKQNRPFARLETEVVLNMVRTLDALRTPMDALLKESGLSDSSYNVLRILRGAGEAGLPCGEIADRMVTRVPDVTRLLDRLLRDGLVSRERSDEDRRVVLSRITDEGMALLEELDGPVDRVPQELLGHLSSEELQTLSALLIKARNPSD